MARKEKKKPTRGVTESPWNELADLLDTAPTGRLCPPPHLSNGESTCQRLPPVWLGSSCSQTAVSCLFAPNLSWLPHTHTHTEFVPVFSDSSVCSADLCPISSLSPADHLQITCRSTRPLCSNLVLCRRPELISYWPPLRGLKTTVMLFNCHAKFKIKTASFQSTN